MKNRYVNFFSEYVIFSGFFSVEFPVEQEKRARLSAKFRLHSLPDWKYFSVPPVDPSFIVEKSEVEGLGQPAQERDDLEA